MSLPLDNYPILERVIDASAAGDNILIPGKVLNTIRVFKLFLVVGGNTNLTFKDGATVLDGPLSMLANGAIVLDFDGYHWFLAALGNDFILNSSAAVQLSGRIYYTQSAP